MSGLITPEIRAAMIGAAAMPVRMLVVSICPPTSWRAPAPPPVGAERCRQCYTLDPPYERVPEQPVMVVHAEQQRGRDEHHGPERHSHSDGAQERGRCDLRMTRDGMAAPPPPDLLQARNRGEAVEGDVNDVRIEHRRQPSASRPRRRLARSPVPGRSTRCKPGEGRSHDAGTSEA